MLYRAPNYKSMFVDISLDSILTLFILGKYSRLFVNILLEIFVQIKKIDMLNVSSTIKLTHFVLIWCDAFDLRTVSGSRLVGLCFSSCLASCLQSKRPNTFGG